MVVASNHSTRALMGHLLGVVLLCGVLFFPHLGHIPFFDKGEPREAIVVQQIFLHGGWLFPLKIGDEIPSKPPLFHWFGALISVIAGRVNEVTTRLPSALFATLGVLMIYGFGRRLFDPQTALYGAVILATSVGYQSEAINARVDMTLNFFLTLSLVGFYLAYDGFLSSPRGLYLFYLILGVSILAKGPVGLIIPGMVIGTFLALRGRWDFLARLCFHKGVVLALVIGVVWYGIALAKGGEDFFNRQIIHENLARFFVRGEGGSGHQKPFYYLFPYLFLLGLPWSLFLPFVVVDWFRDKALSEERSLFLILWASLILLFFSVSAGKRPVYLLPLYPPLSLLIGLWLKQVTEKDRIKVLALKCFGWVSLILGLALFACFIALVTGNYFFDLLLHIQRMLKPTDRADFAIVINFLSQARFLPLVFLLSALLWFSAARRSFLTKPRAVTVRLAALSVLSGFLVHWTVIPAIAAARSYKPFVLEVSQRVGSDPLWLYGEGWDYNSVAFYLGDRAPLLQGDIQVIEQRLKAAPGYFIMGEREWERLLSSGDFLGLPALRSEGTGPEGRDRIVLIRGLGPGRGNS